MALPSDWLRILKGSGFSPRRRLGQNLIVDPGILRRIVEWAGVDSTDGIVEFGSGPGNLTAHLLERAARVWGVELDPLLARMCRAWLAEEGLQLIEGNALVEGNLNPALVEGAASALAGGVVSGLVVVSNLPYGPGSRILVRLLEGQIPWRRMVLTLQEEVASRLLAAPGDRDHGKLTVVAGLHARVSRLAVLPPGAFWPRPKVRSVVLSFEPLPHRADEVPEEQLRELISGIFRFRRKTLRKALDLAGFRPSAAEEAGVDPGLRPGDLDLQSLILIAKRLRG